MMKKTLVVGLFVTLISSYATAQDSEAFYTHCPTITMGIDGAKLKAHKPGKILEIQVGGTLPKDSVMKAVIQSTAKAWKGQVDTYFIKDQKVADLVRTAFMKDSEVCQAGFRYGHPDNRFFITDVVLIRGR